MTAFNRDNFAKNLPDTYAKSTDSNNYKILEIERDAGEEVRKTLESIREIIDIDNATGATLDLYGKRYGQSRGVATDDQYRVMIKAKIARNLVNGSNGAICNAICATFGCDSSDVWLTEYSACVVMFKAFPVEKINEAGFTPKQVLSIIRSMIPAAVTLEPIVVDGTFCFSDSENDIDNSKGFCDVEGGTIGGTLSTIYGAEEETELPI